MCLDITLDIGADTTTLTGEKDHHKWHFSHPCHFNFHLWIMVWKSYVTQHVSTTPGA